MTDKEAVALIQAEFPKYRQPEHSKCKHPDKYGIRRVDRAEEILKSGIAPDRRTSPRNAFRNKPHKHTFHLSESQEDGLHKAMRLLEINTTQELIERALEMLFASIEKGEQNENLD